MRSLSFKLRLVFGVLLLLGVLPGIATVVLMNEASRFEQQADYAHQVLAEHLRLSERGHRLAHHGFHDGTIDDATGRKLRAEVDNIALGLRKLIASEVAIRGKDGIDEEGEELERIDAIMTSLNIALSGGDDKRWSLLIDEAVAEEVREVAEIDKKEASALNAGQTLLTYSAISIGVLFLVALLWLERSISRPIQSMISTTSRMAEGQLGLRVGVMKDREFRDLSDSLNKMADQLEDRQTRLSNLAGALEIQVGERTSELAKVNRELTESSERRKQFLTDISHELRTPLAVIRGDAEVTLRGGDKPLDEYKGALARITGQVQGLTGLVDDLLYVARNEAGAPKVQLRPMDLLPLVRAAADSLRTVLEADDGSIRVSSDAAEAMIGGDAARLSQLLHILFNNAIHYSDGPPCIDIDVVRSTDGFAVIVADKGIGIASADLKSVFDRFHRGKNGSEKNSEGMGIGLPMAKAIAEAHGGTINIESELGQGTKVSVLLPGAQKLRLANEYLGS